jgi:hypothetical protein
MACLGFWGCTNTHVQGQQALPLKKLVYTYGADARGDSTKHCFVWHPMTDFRITAGGVITFESVNDSTMRVIYGRNGTSKGLFHRVKLTPKDENKVPKSFLNGTYKLIGVFDQEEARGLLFIAFYTNGVNLFRVWHEQAIGFQVYVNFFSNQPTNDFEKAGIVFPYSNKIRF